MTPEAFAEYTTGLNSADKRKYTNMYESLRNQSEGEKRSTYNQAGKMLEDQLLLDGHIKRNSYNKIAGDDEKTLIEARQELTKHLSTQYGTFTPAQLQDFVKSYSAAKIKGKIFNPPSRIPTGDKKPAPKAPPSQQIKITRTQLNNFVRLYSKKNGGVTPEQTDPKFLNFVQQNLNIGR